MARSPALVPCLLACALLVAGPAAAQQQQAPRQRDRAPARTTSSTSSATAQITARITQILDGYEDDPAAAARDMRRLFETMIAHAPLRDPAWKEVAAWMRLLSIVAAAPEGERAELLRLFRSSPAFALNLAMALSERDNREGVAALALRLGRERREHLETYATLAAALCVVHDRPLVHRVNENTATAADPLAIFDFFRTTEKATLFGLRKVPTDLLVFVVDTTAPIDEMAWAQARYKGNGNVGDRFYEVTYDRAHYREGATKKITAAGFSFRNILTHGGVCIDQAYFAAHVGKSIGVPTAIVYGRDGDSSHAWVGYLRARGRAVEWNFDSGRYSTYQVVRGSIYDPQTGSRVPDSYLGIAAQAMTDPADKRFLTVALVDAASLLADIRRTRRDFPPADPDPAVRPAKSPRAATAATQLELLETALRTTPASVRGWQVLASMAAAGDLTLAQLKQWSATLFQLCGSSYPEFSLAVLKPMIESVKDVRDGDGLWNAAFKNYSSNADLAAEIRFAQARMWEKHGDTARALNCYHDVLERYANASSRAVEAAEACRRLAKESGKPGAMIPVLEAAWTRTQRPNTTHPAFFMQSNWYRLGRQYAEVLEEAGRAADARRILSQLGL
jgi:hypothetical protein